LLRSSGRVQDAGGNAMKSRSTEQTNRRGSFFGGLEALEDRRLLAAGTPQLLCVGGICTLTNPTSSSVDAAPHQRQPRSGRGAASAPPAVSNPAAAPNLVGVWDGKIKVKIIIITKKFKAKLEIAGQTDTTLTGAITVQGRRAAGTFIGHIDSAGKFRYELKQSGTDITLSGSLSTDQKRMSGKIDLKYHGFKVKGKYDFTREG
jgi:hypothetical protein